MLELREVGMLSLKMTMDEGCELGVCHLGRLREGFKVRGQSEEREEGGIERGEKEEQE